MNSIILIIFLPLLNFIIASIFGRFLGKKGVTFFSVFLMSTTTILSIFSFFFVALKGQFTYLTLGTWINSDFLVVNWGFMFDTLTVSMFLVVNIVSTLVHIYSVSYMSEDPHIVRFLSYLSFFTFFMLILVSADNFIQMFLGWEGVGLCSYLLISFWFTRMQANKAAIKALLVNRVGDFGLSLGIIWLFTLFKTVDFHTVFALAQQSSAREGVDFTWFSSIASLDFICILLFIGSIGKSAQIGLHTWLPDAMEGPTPVSALIHAATMVTAGVFLVIRCSPIFDLAPHSLAIMIFFGSVTAFFAATAGLVQNDVKKVIAYSTCSQLGYMIFACGLSSFSSSFFHLANHAFFKALLFLSAGAVIHGLANEQDMRRMGALLNILPFTYTMILIGSLSLMGFPFFTGFYSKDFILEVAISKLNFAGGWHSGYLLSYWFGTIAAFFTAFYSFRLIYLVFLSRANMYKSAALVSHELPFIMAFPLAILCFGSIFLGYISKDMFVGMGSPIFNNSISIQKLAFLGEFIPYVYKILPVVFSLCGCFSLFLLQFFFEKVSTTNFLMKLTNKYFKSIYNYLVFKWHFDTIYNYYITRKVLYFSYDNTFKTLDKGLIEFLGPFGISEVIKQLSVSEKKDQTGLLYNHVCSMVFQFVFLFFALSLIITFIL